MASSGTFNYRFEVRLQNKTEKRSPILIDLFT